MQHLAGEAIRLPAAVRVELRQVNQCIDFVMDVIAHGLTKPTVQSCLFQEHDLLSSSVLCVLRMDKIESVGERCGGCIVKLNAGQQAIVNHIYLLPEQIMQGNANLACESGDREG